MFLLCGRLSIISSFFLSVSAAVRLCRVLFRFDVLFFLQNGQPEREGWPLSAVTKSKVMLDSFSSSHLRARFPSNKIFWFSFFFLFFPPTFIYICLFFCFFFVRSFGSLWVFTIPFVYIYARRPCAVELYSPSICVCVCVLALAGVHTFVYSSDVYKFFKAGWTRRRHSFVFLFVFQYSRSNGIPILLVGS